MDFPEPPDHGLVASEDLEAAAQIVRGSPVPVQDAPVGAQVLGGRPAVRRHHVGLPDRGDTFHEVGRDELTPLSPVPIPM